MVVKFDNARLALAAKGAEAPPSSSSRSWSAAYAGKPISPDHCISVPTVFWPMALGGTLIMRIRPTPS